ncbi:MULTISPECIES: sodium:solute symporter family protein [unclassified Agarivorans]|uniref:sodium:solute symporter family protein n=1 Tax=unclassified Agarivorans TaxID=2636026 RepID=UPI003D7DF07E
MSIQTWVFIFIGCSFTSYMIIAIWTKANTTREFYLAGAQVHPVTNGIATAASWMSAASFLSLAGLISIAGYDGGIYLMGWTGGYVILALCLVPYLRLFAKITIADFIAERYYSRIARLVAVICIVFISFIYIAGQMRGIGLVFSRFLDVNMNLGVLLGMVIMFIYTVWGGMRGVTYTQVAQYCLLIFAFLVPAFLTSFSLTGQYLPQMGLGSHLLGQPEQYVLDRLDILSLELGLASFTSGHKSLIDIGFVTLALMMGTAGLPHIITRFFTVSGVKKVRSSVGYTLVFIALLYTAIPAVAAFARLNIIESINPQKPLQLEVSQEPQWLNNWLQTGLVEWQDVNGDEHLFYSGDERNEVYLNQDMVVLASPELASLPNWVIALVAAGGLAASLSTAAGLLLVIASSIAHDLGKHIIKPDLTDKQELKWARMSVCAAILTAGYLGVNPPALVAEVIAYAFGLAACSIFPAMVMGIFSKKMNRLGALSGMLVGMSLTLTYISYFKFIEPTANVPEYWWFGISPEGIGALGMLSNFAVAFLVHHCTQDAPESVQSLVAELRRPPA